MHGFCQHDHTLTCKDTARNESSKKLGVDSWQAVWGKRSHLHMVQLWNMGGCDEDRVGLAAILHFDADLGVADHDLALWILLSKREQAVQGQGPAAVPVSSTQDIIPHH